jgi:hypothetical protein
MKLNNTLPPMGSLAHNKAPQAKPNLNTQRDGKVQAILTTYPSSNFSFDKLFRGLEGLSDFHISTSRVNYNPPRMDFPATTHTLSIEDSRLHPSPESLKRELKTMSTILLGKNEAGYPITKRQPRPITSARLEFYDIPLTDDAFRGLEIPENHLLNVYTKKPIDRIGPTAFELIPTIRDTKPADTSPESVIRGLALLTEALSKSL